MMKGILAIAASVIGASSALAGGFEQSAPSPTVAAPVAVATVQGGDWTGAYVGLQASAVDGTNSLDTGEDVFDFSGGLYGVHVGYDHDFGRFVLGGEFEYGQGSVGSDLTPAFGGGDAGIDLDWVARLKLRAGYDLGRTLVYATGGASRASASTSAGFVGSDPGQVDGYFLGAGISFQITERFTAGAEVLSDRFGDFENSLQTDTETGLTSVSVRLGYRF